MAWLRFGSLSFVRNAFVYLLDARFIYHFLDDHKHLVPKHQRGMKQQIAKLVEVVEAKPSFHGTQTKINGKRLIQAGFECVCHYNDVMLFRKRK